MTLFDKKKTLFKPKRDLISVIIIPLLRDKWYRSRLMTLNEDAVRPKQGTTTKSIKSMVYLVVWDAHGKLFMDHLEQGQTINCDRPVVQLVRFN